MATDSKRAQAIAGLVSILAGVTAGASYFYSFNGTNQVQATFEPDDARLMNSYSVSLRVADGLEKHERWPAQRSEATAQLELLIDVLLRHQTGTETGIVVEMNKVLHDILLAVGANPTLGSTVNDAYVAQVDAPVYDAEHNLAAATVHVACLYDYQPGVST